MNDQLISMYIDDELSLDDKIDFVETVHDNKYFRDDALDLLRQEKLIRSEVVEKIPALGIREPIAPWHLRLFRPVAALATGLAAAAGASYVARSTAYHAKALDKLIEGGFRKKGFACIEAVTPCPTAFGRRNKSGTIVDMYRRLREKAITVQAAAKLSPDELRGRIVTGVLVDRDQPEFVEEYQKLVQRIQRNEKPRGEELVDEYSALKREK